MVRPRLQAVEIVWVNPLEPDVVVGHPLGADQSHGGLAGNQGGLRAAALGTFPLSPAAFVATATATALLVDLARAPVYLVAAGSSLLELARPIAIATLGCLVGTIAGERVLLGLSRDVFTRVVAIAIAVLGLWLLFGAGR